MDPGHEQRLGAIHVAYPTNDPLIEQRRRDGHALYGQPLPGALGISLRVERVRAKAGEDVLAASFVDQLARWGRQPVDGGSPAAQTQLNAGAWRRRWR